MADILAHNFCIGDNRIENVVPNNVLVRTVGVHITLDSKHKQTTDHTFEYFKQCIKKSDILFGVRLVKNVTLRYTVPASQPAPVDPYTTQLIPQGLLAIL
jgi:hypothetical protein